jgi:hypothetical protein
MSRIQTEKQGLVGVERSGDIEGSPASVMGANTQVRIATEFITRLLGGDIDSASRPARP